MKKIIKEVNEFTKQKTLDKTIHIDYTQERVIRGYKMSRPNVQKILCKNVQLVCLF